MINKKSTAYRKLFYALILLTGTFASCMNTRQAVYFNNIGDTVINRDIGNLEPVIQKNDLLSITVNSPNAAATQIFNAPVYTSAQVLSYASTQALGYLVNQNGFIEFPMLGNVKAAGLTKVQLKENITRSLVQNQLLMDPVVVVRYLNYKVTVLGEVAHPMVINVPDEKMNLLEALGLAGDMTIYAKRDNVVLIREEEGRKIIKRLDLNSKDLLGSPYYYLKSNDIVYVEPNKAKVSIASNTRVWLPVVLSGLSFAVVILDRITR